MRRTAIFKNILEEMDDILSQNYDDIIFSEAEKGGFKDRIKKIYSKIVKFFKANKIFIIRIVTSVISAIIATKIVKEIINPKFSSEEQTTYARRIFNSFNFDQWVKRFFTGKGSTTGGAATVINMKRVPGTNKYYPDLGEAASDLSRAREQFDKLMGDSFLLTLEIAVRDAMKKFESDENFRKFSNAFLRVIKERPQEVLDVFFKIYLSNRREFDRLFDLM